jgi:hypothetical protein
LAAEATTDQLEICARTRLRSVPGIAEPRRALPSIGRGPRCVENRSAPVPDRTLCRESHDVRMTDDNALLERLRRAVSEADVAPLTPVRVRNRLMTKVQQACDQLASTQVGRSALEWAAKFDPEPTVRLTAANTVARWDPEAGATALEALVTESGGRVTRPMTMSAALEVEWGTGRDAALCLLNLDRKSSQPEPPMSRGTAGPRVPADLLDAAERVYGLAMNGGVGHAYEVAGDDFGAAMQALDAVGATAAARALREAVRVLGQPSLKRRDREVAVNDASDSTQSLLSRLDAEIDAEDVMKLLESATES